MSRANSTGSNTLFGRAYFLVPLPDTSKSFSPHGDPAARGGVV
jgi:hypothetical protein